MNAIIEEIFRNFYKKATILIIIIVVLSITIGALLGSLFF